MNSAIFEPVWKWFKFVIRYLRSNRADRSSYTSTESRPRVVVIGPDRSDINGLTTFVYLLLSSPYMQERYELFHLNTTRAESAMSLAERYGLMHVVHFIPQALELVRLRLRYQAALAHVPLLSFRAFWKNAAFILLARVLGMKVVAHLHGGLFDRYYRQSSPRIQGLIGWMMRQADVVIALSDSWRRFLLEEVSPNIKVEVVFNTVDYTFAQVIDQVSQRGSPNNKSVLFVGALGNRKGVYDILKAVPLVTERQPEVKFLFAGPEEEGGEQAEINEVCTAMNLKSAVEFLGPVTGQAKVDLFLQAALFVLPSYGENMPYVLLEAMSAGLPVITTPVGAIPELVEDGQNGFLIQPGDYQALSERIVQLLEDASLRAAMSKANVERIRSGYLPDVAMAQIDQIYGQLLDVRQQWKTLSARFRTTFLVLLPLALGVLLLLLRFMRRSSH